jgi:hypothetical protein
MAGTAVGARSVAAGELVEVVDPVPPCPDWTVVGVDRAPVEREDASAARMKPGMRRACAPMLARLRMMTPATPTPAHRPVEVPRVLTRTA